MQCFEEKDAVPSHCVLFHGDAKPMPRCRAVGHTLPGVFGAAGPTIRCISHSIGRTSIRALNRPASGAVHDKGGEVEDVRQDSRALGVLRYDGYGLPDRVGESVASVERRITLFVTFTSSPCSLLRCYPPSVCCLSVCCYGRNGCDRAVIDIDYLGTTPPAIHDLRKRLD